MKRSVRIGSVLLAVLVLHLCALPCLGAGEAVLPGVKKVTTNDPQFTPLSEEQAIKTGVKWYWYVLGADRSPASRRRREAAGAEEEEAATAARPPPRAP